MNAKLTYYVDQHIGKPEKGTHRIVTTKFTDKTGACIFAEAIGGTFRLPKETRSVMGNALFTALEAIQ